MEDFDLKEDEDFDAQRLDTEWVVLNALREMLGIGLKDNSNPTYAHALSLGKQLAPALYDSPQSLIGRKDEPAAVREYRQRAEAESELSGKIVDPLNVLEPDITQLEVLMRSNSKRPDLIKRLNQLRQARTYFSPQKYTETQLLIRDTKEVKRDFPNSPYSNSKYVDYPLAEGRGLRIRLLHPDPPEHSIGADLIYETYWDKKRLARLAVVQYKIWNGKALYTSQTPNLEEQLVKLTRTFCKSGLCQPASLTSELQYRLPPCIAFLRPTDKLQKPDSSLISSGLHLPVCIVNRAWQDTGHGGKKIEKKMIRSEALSHKVFEELFNTNMVGSRWLTYQELEELYHQHKIIDPKEKIIIHAQEYEM